ncbi:hypothetical protein GCM10023187_10970 [Nibrella viscosa]|uniref:PA14 domain-containing protein n=1 Tax=Nibrella viscosa TaxID=1084524 RepID=A0ABP8K1J1_9BACT
MVNIDHFSVRWSGQIEAPVTGTYIFRTNNDDGTRLWINNQLLIDNWALQSPTLKEGSIQLVAGQKYSLTMEYFEYDAGAQALLMWLVPGTSTVVTVPKERLYPAELNVSLPSFTSMELVNVLDWNLYPNPAQDYVTIDIPNVYDPNTLHFSGMSSSGRITDLPSYGVQFSGTKASMNVDIKALQGGVNFILVKQDKDTPIGVLKFIKQ